MKKNCKKYPQVSLFGLLMLITANLTIAAVSPDGDYEKNDRYKFENKNIKFGLYPRTPEQMAAFYEGRGFQDKAINKIAQTCFITVGMRNLSGQKIWLDLKDWKFYSSHGNIERIDRYKWQEIWKQLDVPLANQSTFTWTLLPEARDLHPDEPVGGNLIFVPVDIPFTIEANFKTGEDKNGKPLQVKMENVKCDKNKSSP